MDGLTIRLLGKPSVMSKGVSIIDRLSKKALALLVYLAAGPAKEYSREELAGLLWGEMDQVNAHYNFRRVLWTLRREINPKNSAHDYYIRFNKEIYFLNKSSNYWLDVTDFEKAVSGKASYLGDPYSISSTNLSPSEISVLEQAIELYQDDFMVGFRLPSCPVYEEWMFLERDRLKFRYLAGLRLLGKYYFESRNYPQALLICQKIIKTDPTDEGAHRELMSIYTATGNREEALSLYQQLSQTLKIQLNMEPLLETQNLYEHIRTGSYDIPGLTYPGSLPPEIPTTRACFPFVGRVKEMSLLCEARDIAAEGNGLAIAIIGEAGVGKSRLVEEFLPLSKNLFGTVLQSRCYYKKETLPYQAIIDALRSYLPSMDSEYLSLLDDVWLAEILNLLPEMHALLSKTPLSPALFPEQERNRLFEGVAQFLIHVSQRSPIILFIDDLHFADEPTIELLHYLVRRLNKAQVLFLLTMREPDVLEDPALWNMIWSLKRAGHLRSYPLERLPETEALILINETLPKEVSSTNLAHKLYEETGGNPFYLIEMIIALQEQSEGVFDPLPIPHTLRELVWGRLKRLDSSSKRTLNMAAVLRQKFDWNTLKQLFPGDEEQAIETLDLLLERNWIERVNNDHTPLYDFSHGLVREIIYQQISQVQRQHLHLKIGEMLETREEAKGELAGILASHFWEAGEYDRAQHYLLMAADYSRKLYAYREAKEYYLRAFTAFETLINPLPPSKHLEVLLELGRIQQLLGEYEAAIGTYQQAVKEEMLDGVEGEIILNDVTRRQICLQLALTYDRKGEYRQALNLLQILDNRISETDEPEVILEKAQVAWGIARVHLHQEQHYQALSLCNHALALLSRLEWSENLGSIQVSIFHTLARSNFDLGQYETAVQNYQKSLEIARRLNQQAIIPRLLIGLGNVARRWGDYSQAEAYAKESLLISQKIGLVFGTAASHGTLGNVAYNRGKLDDAFIHYKQALEIFRQLGEVHGIADYCLSLGFVLFDQGEIEAADRYLLEAQKIGETLNADLVLIRAEYHLAKVAKVRGEIEKARRLVTKAIRRAESAGIELMKALGYRLLGEILAQEHEPVQGELHILESLRILEKLGERFEVAWTLRSLAQVFISLSDTERAQELLNQAVSIFDDLKAERELKKTLAELTRLNNRK